MKCTDCKKKVLDQACLDSLLHEVTFDEELACHNKMDNIRIGRIIIWLIMGFSFLFTIVLQFL
jgi:hypothetical protein